MSISIQAANVYGDLQGLEKLRHASDVSSEEKLRFVAQQFEALFLQMMLKTAHPEGGDEEDPFNDQQSEFYQDWYDKQLSIDLAAGRGVGIAELLVKQLQQTQGALAEAPIAVGNEQPITVKGKDYPLPVTGGAAVTGGRQNKAVEPALQTPEQFVQHLLPYAQAAGEKLGVSPQVLLAQAALETGWGKRITQSASGASSNNLFNIKADGRWQGERVAVTTLEYKGDVVSKERAEFRAYDSYHSSFEDYVDFIQSGKRYQKALALAGDDHAYVQELARAGYATDPEYSGKIMKLLESGQLAGALDPVKL